MAIVSKQNNANLKKALDKLGALYIKRLKEELIKADKKASGDLIRSLKYRVVQISPTELSLQVLNIGYLHNVDEGRRAGKKQPPLEPIIKWIKQKNLHIKKGSTNGGQKKKNHSVFNRRIKRVNSDKLAKQLAFAIAKSISKHGIKPTNVMTKAFEVILRFRKELGRSAAEDIQNLIITTLKEETK